LPKILKARIALLVVLGAHLAISLCVFPPRVVFGGQPIAYADYALHFSRAVTADAMLSHYGRQWGYNPFFLAGYPAGTVFDVNNHFIEVFVFLLHRLHVSPPTAFNLLAFLGFFLAPVWTWLSARNFGLSLWPQVCALAFSSALLVSDSQINITWRVGVLASEIAMCGLPFALSCLFRYHQDRSNFWFLAFLISGSVFSVVHPLSFIFLYAVVALYFLWRIRTLDARFIGGLGLFALAVLLANSFWIPGFLRHLPLKLESGQHFIGNLQALRFDVFAVHDSGLRLLVYLMGIGGLIGFWREGRKELVRLFLFTITVLTILGYLGGELRALRQLETYRLNFIVSFLLAVPAGAFVGTVVSYLRSLSFRQALAFTAMLLLLLLNLTGRNLDWFAPFIRGSFRHYARMPLSADDQAVIRWLKSNANPDHRILVEYWPMGALIPWYAGMQVIGGPYPLIWMPHNFANYADLKGAMEGDPVFLFGRDIRRFTPDQAKLFLNAYNVGWVVAYTDRSNALFGSSPSLKPVADIGSYRVYENTDVSTFFLKGTGNVEAEFGALIIRDASEGELVLKFHWTATLTSDPPQELQPQKILDDPVPFIRIPKNHFREFVLRDAPRGFVVGW
jgi:hypothetical protein